MFFWKSTDFTEKTSDLFAFLTRSLPCCLMLRLCSDHFLCRPRTSHNQILNKSGKWEQAYVTEKQRGRPLARLSSLHDRKQWTKPAFCCKRVLKYWVQRGQPVFSVPQEIILLIQFLPRILSQSHDLPGDYLYHLPFRHLPPSQLIGFSFSSSSNSFTACVIGMICHCCAVYLRSAHICHWVRTWENRLCRSEEGVSWKLQTQLHNTCKMEEIYSIIQHLDNTWLFSVIFTIKWDTNICKVNIDEWLFLMREMFWTVLLVVPTLKSCCAEI